MKTQQRDRIYFFLARRRYHLSGGIIFLAIKWYLVVSFIWWYHLFGNREGGGLYAALWWHFLLLRHFGGSFFSRTPDFKPMAFGCYRGLLVLSWLIGLWVAYWLFSFSSRWIQFHRVALDLVCWHFFWYGGTSLVSLSALL